MTAKPPYLPLPKAKRHKASEQHEQQPNNYRINSTMEAMEQKFITTNTRKRSSSDSCIIVFDGNIAKEMTKQRLPTQYVGVRRVRPSSKIVHKVFVQERNVISNIGQEQPQQAMNQRDPTPLDTISTGTRIPHKEDKNNNNDDDLFEHHSSLTKPTPVLPFSTSGSSDFVLSCEVDTNMKDRIAENRTFDVAKATLSYKVIDPLTGKERRMNTKEKKELKLKLAAEKRVQQKEFTKQKVELLEQKQKIAKIERKKKKKKQFQQQQETKSENEQNQNKETNGQLEQEVMPNSERNNDDRLDTTTVKENSCGINFCTSSDSIANQKYDDKKGSSQRSYLQLQIDPMVLEQELADLRGDRDGVPPVVLSPPLANVACKYHQRHLFPGYGDIYDLKDSKILASSETEMTVIDDDLASEWCLHLKKSMYVAETIRQNEDMRPMPYDVRPECWTRLRPSSLVGGNSNVPCQKVIQVEDNDNKSTGATCYRVAKEWDWCCIRPQSLSTMAYDNDTRIIVDLLHSCTDNLHICMWS